MCAFHNILFFLFFFFFGLSLNGFPITEAGAKTLVTQLKRLDFLMVAIHIRSYTQYLYITAGA